MRAFANTFLVVLLLATAVAPAGAQRVWSGHDFLFAKAPFANPSLPDSQDRISDAVWLTRATQRGLYNAAAEPGFTSFVSPEGTEWAFGRAADWQTLAFDDWQNWHGSDPPSSVGRDAVVHLIAEDIYIDIRFTEWGETPGAGGSFAYARAPNPCPSDLTLEGDVNTNDFFKFLALFQSADPRADFEPGGGINTNDFFAYLAAFQQGC